MAGGRALREMDGVVDWNSPRKCACRPACAGNQGTELAVLCKYSHAYGAHRYDFRGGVDAGKRRFGRGRIFDSQPHRERRSRPSPLTALSTV